MSPSTSVLSPSTTSTTSMPTTTTIVEVENELVMSCEGRFRVPWPYEVLTTTLDYFEGDFGEYITDQEAMDEFNRLTPVEWWVVDRSDTEANFFGVTTGVQGLLYSYATFRFEDGRWKTFWGTCTMMADADGFGIATFVLDSSNPPDPSSNVVHLLATERACRSGQPPDGLEVNAVALETETTVDIVVFVERPTGDFTSFTCQANPPFQVEVTLDMPLGDRLIRDVALHPVVDHPWPPLLPDPRLDIYLAGDAPKPGTANVYAWDGLISGALAISPSSWQSGRTWWQGFTGVPYTISGYVADCEPGGCAEECEDAACDALNRFGPECSYQYVPEPGTLTELTVVFSGNTCTIEVTESSLAS